MTKCISLDFDGVVHQHLSAWTDAHDIHDPPVPGAFDFIRGALDAGLRVVIFTARAKTATVVPQVYAWFRAHGLEEKYTWQLEVTCIKHAAVVYIDDHGWRFDGTFPSLETIRALKPWNRP